MTAYQKPFAINEEFNTNDYLTNDKILTKREGNTLFVQKALEGASWEDFLEYMRDTYGIEFSLSISNDTVIKILEDTDLVINLPDSTSGSRYVRINLNIFRLTGLTSDISITSLLFYGDLTGNATTSTTTLTAVNYTPISGIDTSITSLSKTIYLPYNTFFNSSTKWLDVGSSSPITFNITDNCTLSMNGDIRTIAGASPIVKMFGNNLVNITMDNDFEVYIYEGDSVHPLVPYNYLSFLNNAANSSPYVFFGQFDDLEDANGSNDYPFLRVSTNSENTQFATFALNNSNEIAATRGAWRDVSRFQVLRFQYQPAGENFIYSVIPNAAGGAKFQINAATLAEVICLKNFTATGTKTFDIVHPLDDTKRLRHACCECSEVKNIYRGSVSVVKSCIINLDAHFGMTTGTMCALNKNISASVSNNATFDNAIGYLEKCDLHIEVETDEPTTISFIVWGTRQDDNIKKATTTDDNGDLITEFYKVRDDE
tara:strand:- start:814 stop:2268 length:1455 start_codon:yes stop_codon:yes gene_type:complete